MRLEALRSYGILDTPVEGAFDDITRMAAHVCQVPIAVVNLIDEGRQWFKSEIGLGVRETPLETSICAHAILEEEFLEIPDTTLDERFRCNPLVTGSPGLRFYAGALLRDPAGHALGTVCVLDTQPRTLTEEQRNLLRGLARQTMAQLELRRALSRTERARRYRSRLMAIAGHDLMQPLSVITVVIEELRRAHAGNLPDEQLELAAAAASALGRDLTRLAQASRDDADREDITLVPFPLDDVLDAVRDNWSFSAARKGLQLHVDSSPLQLLSHPGMLRTVLDNLIGNAIKYTTTGSVWVSAGQIDGHVHIDVRDTGIGIPEHLLGPIFEAFRQADPGNDGLGLGLSIAKRTADSIGCKLTVESRECAGSLFRVRMPSIP
ncbi:MAG: GAF domain-containing sensor histidine kinase [Thermomonas sp.]